MFAPIALSFSLDKDRSSAEPFLFIKKSLPTFLGSDVVSSCSPVSCRLCLCDVSTFAWLLFIHSVFCIKRFSTVSDELVPSLQDKGEHKIQCFFLHCDYSEPVPVNSVYLMKLLIVLIPQTDKIKT